MAIFKSIIAKRASKESSAPVRLVKSNSQKSVVKNPSAKKDINIIPKEGQIRKTIKTYQGGQLVKKEKQGHDILGRETTKQKTYSGGKVTSVTKRVAGKNFDTKVVREGGVKQVSKAPAMPKMKDVKVYSPKGKGSFFALEKDNAGSCNRVFRKKRNQEY